MTKQIIFGNGQPVFNGPALEPDPIAARFEAEKHAENAKRLRVCVESEDDERNISREEAPALFEAWDHWQLTEARSLAEKAAWDKVLELAQNYLHSIDRDSDDVSDVTDDVASNPLLSRSRIENQVPTLECETDTPAVEKRILRAARIQFKGIISTRGFRAYFEHGQWWLTHLSGAQWAVNDTDIKGCYDFELVTKPAKD